MKIHRTPNDNAYKSVFYCRKIIQNNCNRIKVQVCIKAKDCFTTSPGMISMNSNCPLPVKVILNALLLSVRNHKDIHGTPQKKEAQHRGSSQSYTFLIRWALFLPCK